MNTAPVTLNVTALQAMGTVSADGVFYRTQPGTADDTAIGQFNSGDRVTVTGMVTIEGTPANWYRIQLADQDAWIAARYVQLDSALPVLAPSDGQDALVNAGVTIGVNEVISDELGSALATFLTANTLKLRGTFTATNLTALSTSLNKLADYGVMLTSPDDGIGWSMDEVTLFERAVDMVAAHVETVLRSRVGAAANDLAFAFRFLYAPLRILRVNKDTVSPTPGSLWWASNMDGYNIRYGNLAFKGRGLQKPSGSSRDLALSRWNCSSTRSNTSSTGATK